MNRLEQALYSLNPTAKDTFGSMNGNITPSPAKLMTHVVLGYPSLEKSIELVKVMAASGACFIELQIPFSDPLADGPTISHANQIALSNGTTPEHCINAIAEIRRQTSIPLLVMTYYNIPFTIGLKKFIAQLRDAQIDGIIIPDIPPEESADNYWSICTEAGIIPIPLVSPVSTHKRLQKIASQVFAIKQQRLQQHGFVYGVATTGTTGVRGALPANLAEYTQRIRDHFQLPVAIGFGISTPEQVKELGRYADIAIVGSAVINLLDSTPESRQLDVISQFVKQLSG